MRQRVRTWWSQLSFELRAAVVFLSLAGVAVSGVLTVSLVSSSPSSYVTSYTEAVTYQDYLAQTVTVSRTVREKGKVIVKKVPVVKQVFRPPVTMNHTETVSRTQTLATPGSTRVVTHPVVRTRRVVTSKVVTVKGKPLASKVVIVKGKPVTVKRVVTTTQVQTRLQTVTNQRTVVQVQRSTDTKIQTATQTETQTTTTTVTRTTTSPTQTVTTTVTATVTLPARTVTLTRPIQTVTQTVTVTTTGP